MNMRTAILFASSLALGLTAPALLTQQGQGMQGGTGKDAAKSMK